MINQVFNEMEINVNARLDKRQLITQSSRKGTKVFFSKFEKKCYIRDLC